MSIHNFNPDIEMARQRRENARDTQQRLVLMGNGLGRDPAENLYARNIDGSTSQYLWVRDLGGKSESGYNAPGLAYRVLPGVGPSPEIDKLVWIEWESGPRMYRVKISDPDHMTETGRSMHLENPSDPQNQFHRTEQLLPLRAQWIGGLRVSVQGWQYRDSDGDYRAYPGTSGDGVATSQHVNLTALVPATAASHCYALISYSRARFAAGLDPLKVWGSTEQSWFVLLDNSDINECFAQIPADSEPVWLFRLATGDTDNRGHADDRDVRGWLNVTSDTGMTQLTGDVTAGPGSGSQVATIANGAVTDAKISDVSTTKLTGLVPLANGGTHADLSATGAATHFLRQASIGADVSVSAIVAADLTTALTTPPPIGATTPNTIVGTTGAFTGDITLSGAPGKIKPAVNSTTALQIANAAGTGFVTFNTTNSRVGIGTVTPARTLTLYDNSAFIPLRLQNATRYMDFILDTNGNLNLNSDATSTTVGVSGSANPQFRANSTTGNVVGKFQAIASSAVYVGSETNHNTSFIANNTQRIILVPGGSGGISIPQDASGVGIGIYPASAAIHTVWADTLSSGGIPVAIFGRNTSGTPVAGFGGAIHNTLKSSTTTNQDASDIATSWATSTHASRASQLDLSAYSVSTKQVGLSIRGDSGGVKIGVYGVTPVARSTGGAAAAGALYTATEQAMLQTVYDAVRNIGIMT